MISKFIILALALCSVSCQEMPELPASPIDAPVAAPGAPVAPGTPSVSGGKRSKWCQSTASPDPAKAAKWAAIKSCMANANPEMSAKQEQTKKECFATAMPGATYPSSSADMKAIYCDAANAPKIDAFRKCMGQKRGEAMKAFGALSADEKKAKITAFKNGMKAIRECFKKQ